MNGGRKAKGWSHLHPRTSTKPIDMAEFLNREERSLLIDSDRLTPEFVAWHKRMREQKRYRKP